MRVPQLPIAIETERMVLRRWRPEDALDLYRAVRESADRVGKWLPWVEYYTEPAAATFFISQAAEGWRTGVELPLGIFDRKTGRVLGGTGLHSNFPGTPIHWDWGTFETGYWLRDGEEGKGLMREAVRAQIRLVFEHLGANMLAIRADARNSASRRVALALGFHHDATARNDSVATDGQLRTTDFFSLIRSEAIPLLASWRDDCFRLVFDASEPPVEYSSTAPNADTADIEANFVRPLRIESERLVLRPPRPEDSDAYFAMVDRSRPELERWLATPRRIKTPQDARTWISAAAQEAEARTSFPLLAFEKASGGLIGAGSLHGFDWSVPAAEIDWSLDTARTGRGFATEIGGMQAQFALHAWGAHRIEVWTEARNIASVRVAERLGFTPEGIRRAAFANADRQLSDWATFSLIPDDIPQLPRPLPEIDYLTD